jgi:hypothetical protein
MRKIIVAFLISLAPAAHAWGPVEQAALIGAIGGALIGRATAEPMPPQYAPPPQVYYHPPHQSGEYYYGHVVRRQCFRVPLYDQYGRYVSSTRRCDYVQY